MSRLLLAMRVHGPLDGLLVTIMRFFYRRRCYRVGYVFDAASNRLENWWFHRRLRQFGFGDARGGVSPSGKERGE